MYLSDDEREVAAIIPQALHYAHGKVKSGERQSQLLKDSIIEQLQKSSLVSIDYVEVVNGDSLEPVTTVDAQTRILVAVRVGSARLIDNINALVGINTA